MIQRYQVLSQLARGGMGEILLARRIGPAGFEKLVVLKRPLPHLAGSGAVIEALVDEARLLAQINHPNVCQVYDLEETDGQYYLALEYLDGLSLWTLLGGPPIDPRATAGMIEQACDGLDAIHALRGKGGELVHVVHRDISPGNLMLTAAGAVKILDLGIAKTADSADLTPFGRVKGKLPYVAPEQAKGHAIDMRVDIFALGLVLYDLLRGQRPSERIGALAADSLDFTGIPPELADVVRIAVAIDPAARFQSARDMGLAVRRAGAAFGGSFDRNALAGWLAATHANELRQKRGVTSVEASSETQILSLRSVLPVEPPPMRSRETERLELRAVSPPRPTERLELPEHERIEPSSPPPSPSTPRRGRRLAMIAAASVIAGVAVALITARGGNSSAADAAPQTSIAAASSASDAGASTDTPTSASEIGPPTTVAVANDAGVASGADSTSDGIAPDARPPDPPIPPQKLHQDTGDRIKPEPGRISVDSSPWADVRLGSRKLGQTPLYRISFPPGRYRLHAVTEDGHAQNMMVTVEAGREKRIRLEWK